MIRILTKSIGLRILICIILIVCSLPVFTGTVEGKTNDYHSNPYQENHEIPLTSHHLLFSCTANITLPPNPFTVNTVIFLAWSHRSQIIEPSFNEMVTYLQNQAQESPPLVNEYHCRNCLNSDEPTLV